MVYKFLIVVVVSLSGKHLEATITLTGDKDAPVGQTFSFPVKANIQGGEGDKLYLGSHPTLGSPQEFALSLAAMNSSNIFPFAPAQAMLNNEPTSSNPLYNSHVQLLGLLSSLVENGPNQRRDENPVVVISESPASVFLVDTSFVTQAPSVLSVAEVKDANNMTTSGMVGLGNIASSFAVAAVKPTAPGSNFLDTNSGLGVLMLDTSKQTVDNRVITKRLLKQIDLGVPGNPAENRALLLDKTSLALGIGGDVTPLPDNFATFEWDEALKVFYGALQLQSGAASSGARAAFRIFLHNKSFLLLQIAPNAVFTGPTAPNMIVGTSAAGAEVDLYSVKTMYTSTRLNYLIVLGGAPTNARNTVFALPLVNSPEQNAIHGAIADKNETPPTLSKNPGFKTAATTPAQMTLSTDAAAMVGSGPLPAGDISSMFVKDDSVYVSVFTPNVGQLPGVFYSEALFDSVGKIKGWTEWRRVAGNTDSVFGFSLDSLGNFTMMTGLDADSLTKINRTVWGTNDKDGLLGGTTDNASVGLINQVSSQLPKSMGGIQALFNFPSNTPGLNGISLLIGTGLQRIVLAQTGQTAAGVFVPDFGDFTTDQFAFNEGVVTQNFTGALKTRIVTISGGALNDLGPITSAEITTDGDENGWLFVGGVSGLAILANPDGTGWQTPVELGNNFTGLKNGMRFKKLGAYSFIRRLFADDTFLYVMTDKKLDRIDLTKSNFATGALSVATLATIGGLPGTNANDTLLDVVVSDKLGLLATSKGLLRSGNGTNIATAASANFIGWTMVALPESLGPATELFAISKTGRAQDVARSGGGMIYLLNAYVGKNRGQTERFAIQDVTTPNMITSSTVVSLPDYFLVGILSYLVNFNGFRDHNVTDGAAFFDSVQKNLAQDPLLEIRFNVHSGFGSGAPRQPLSLSGASQVNRIVRSFASGAWLVGGDFGLQVSE